MKTLFTFIIVLSFCFSNDLHTISSNIRYFSLMNSGSFIHHAKRDSYDNTYSVYNLSLISFPANIRYGSFGCNYSLNTFEIYPSFRVINYGGIDSGINKFNASEQLIDITILRNNNDSFTTGASLSYYWSNIADYKQSSIVYNVGLLKSIFSNQFSIGLAIEDYIKTIDDYSNIDSESSFNLSISSHYSPSHTPVILLMDYIYHNNYDDQLIISFDINMNNQIKVLLGKIFYFSDSYESNNYLSNFGIGTRLKFKKSIVNIGVQYLNHGVLSIGTGLTTQLK